MGYHRHSNPRVSVIMTVTAKTYLHEAIDSVLRQSYEPWELVIVDDGSSDGSAAVIERARRSGSRVRLLTHTRNAGRVPSLNEALDAACGAYCAILDHDDIALPERLEAQSAYLDTHPDTTLCASFVRIIDERGRTVSLPTSPTDPEELSRVLPKRNPLFHSSVMFRNEPSTRYREKIFLTEDYDLYLLLLSAGKRIAVLPRILAEYRLSLSSGTLAHRAHQELFAMQCRTFYAERQKTGHDSYDSFDPATILAVDPETSMDAMVMRATIGGLYRANQFAQTRAQCLRYFRVHGFDHGVFLRYCASFLGAPAARIKRRLFPPK